MAETKNSALSKFDKDELKEWKLIRRMARKDFDFQKKFGEFVGERARIECESKKILSMFRGEECGYRDFAAMPPIDGKVLLSLLTRVDLAVLDKANQIISARNAERSKTMLDSQHGHSRKEKAEAIDYYRQHPELTQAKCIDYLREYFPNGQKRPELLTHSKVKNWLNGSRKK